MTIFYNLAKLSEPRLYLIKVGKSCVSEWDTWFATDKSEAIHGTLREVLMIQSTIDDKCNIPTILVYSHNDEGV